MKATTKAVQSEAPVQRRKPLTVIAAVLAGAMALSGCAIQRIDNAQKESEGHAKTAENYLQDLQNRADLVNSRSPLRKMDHLWVDTTPMPLTNKSLGAPVTALDCNITFNPKSPITLAEFGRVVTNLCGLSVNVTQDATALLNGTLMARSDGGSAGAAGMSSPGAISAGALPPPNLTGAPGMSMAAPISNSVFGSGQSDMISGISWVNKPLRGLLDLVTARLGLGWKFEDNTAVIYFTDTKVFQLYSIPGKTSMASTVKSGAEKSGSSTGESTSSFSADGSSQETSVSFETDIMGDIEKTLKTMITPELGRLSVSASTGTVTVTDRPDVLRRIKEYIDSENKRITRQVLLNVKVLSVQIEDGDSAGVNWKAVYETVNRQLGVTNGFSQANGGFNGSIGIINGGKWDGTELFINALSSQGRVSTLSSPSVTTLNLKPAPILVGTQTTYLAQVSTNLVEGGSGTSQQSLTPGTVTTGFNMTLLPYLMEGPEMLLQYSINLSSLTGMKTIESGENKIEMPEVDNRIFSQSVRLRSGETLVLAGFDQSVTNSNKEGVGDAGFWLLGGKGDRSKRRDVIVVLITPVVTD